MCAHISFMHTCVRNLADSFAQVKGKYVLTLTFYPTVYSTDLDCFSTTKEPLNETYKTIKNVYTDLSLNVI